MKIYNDYAQKRMQIRDEDDNEWLSAEDFWRKETDEKYIELEKKMGITRGYEAVGNKKNWYKLGEEYWD